MRLGSFLILLCFLVGVTPVAVFWLWPHSRALQHEFDDASVSNLIIARQLTESLSGYGGDLVNTFTLITRNLVNGAPVQDYRYTLASQSMRQICLFDLASSAVTHSVNGSSARCPAILDADELTRLSKFIQTQKPLITPVTLSDDGKPVLQMIQRIDNLLAVATIDTDYFVALAKSVRFGENGHALILDESGNVLGHRNTRWVEQRENLSAIPEFDAALSGESELIRFKFPNNDEEFMAGTGNIHEFGWTVVVPQSLREVQARADEGNRIALGVVLIGAILSAILAWLAANFLRRPIERLTQSIQEVGDGELEFESKPPSGLLVPKEFAEADAALADMAGRMRESAEELKRMAYVDNLTGLPNRQHFREIAERSLKQAATTQTPVTLLFCDLDRFKEINDTHGHRAGDDVLTAISARFQTFAQTMTDTLAEDISVVPARLGGDEFAVLFTGLSPIQVKPMAMLLLSEIKKPFRLHDMTLTSVGASVGLSGYPAHGENMIELLRCSDAAMYCAKREGSTEAVIYHKDLAQLSGQWEHTQAV